MSAGELFLIGMIYGWLVVIFVWFCFRFINSKSLRRYLKENKKEYK